MKIGSVKVPDRYPSKYLGRKIITFSQWRNTRKKKMNLKKESGGCIETSGYIYKGGDYIECSKHNNWKKFSVVVGNLDTSGSLDHCERFLFHLWTRENAQADIEHKVEGRYRD